MIYPAIRELVGKTGSRYSLVIATAKRARELVDGNAPTVIPRSNKTVSVAVDEIYKGTVMVGEKSDIVAVPEIKSDFSEYVVPSNDTTDVTADAVEEEPSDA